MGGWGGQNHCFSLRFSMVFENPHFRLLRSTWALLGRSWGRLGAILGRLGPSWGDLGGVLGRLGGILGRLGGILGRLGGAWRLRRPGGRLGDVQRRVLARITILWAGTADW